MKNPVISKQNAGFTLIELSIVLVIIGLIVGGVLVGQDLIKAAELRATITQMEKYDAAVNTFRGKYNGYPGDIATASNFGFETTNQGSKTGNGLVNRVTDTDGTLLDTEAALFFRHLAQANMISEPVTQADGLAANVDAISAVVPLSKMGRGNYITVLEISGLNYMFLAGISSVTDGVVTFSDAISPVEAFQMDTKMDDGVATTGGVIAVTNYATANTDESGGGAAAGECVNSTAYYTSSTVTADVSGCMLRRRASF